MNETPACHTVSPHPCNLLADISFSFKNHLKDFCLNFHHVASFDLENISSETIQCYRISYSSLTFLSLTSREVCFLIGDEISKPLLFPTSPAETDPFLSVLGGPCPGVRCHHSQLPTRKGWRAWKTLSWKTCSMHVALKACGLERNHFDSTKHARKWIALMLKPVSPPHWKAELF